MFVFSSLASIAVWFVVRLAYDLVVPSGRSDARHARRRFRTVTGLATALVALIIGTVFARLYSVAEGVIAGVLFGALYLVLVSFLWRLAATWQAHDEGDAA